VAPPRRYATAARRFAPSGGTSVVSS
jgi:hypothetical protein